MSLVLYPLSYHEPAPPRFRIPARDTPSPIARRRGGRAAGPTEPAACLQRDAGGSRTHFRPACNRPPGRLAPASRRTCPRQESNLALDLRRVVCLPHTPRTFTRRNTPARSRTWTTAFEAPRAVRHTPGASHPAGAQGFEPCARVLEARCSPRSTPRSCRYSTGYPPGFEPGPAALTTPGGDRHHGHHPRGTTKNPRGPTPHRSRNGRRHMS